MILINFNYVECSESLGIVNGGSTEKLEARFFVGITDADGEIYCGGTLFKHNKLTTRVGCWEKSNPSPMNGTKLWLSGMEFCVFARKPKAVFNEHCKKALWRHPSGRSKIHPTQKPTALMEQLILASSNEGETVLDFTFGSGTTGVACKNTNRKFIGIEMDDKYFEIGKNRILGE